MFGHPFAIECRKSHIDRMRLPELKERVYAEKNTNLPHLREVITRVSGTITHDIC